MKAKIISFFSVLIFGAVICFTGCKAAILVDCKECVSVTFEGYNGSGQAISRLNENYIVSLLGEMNNYTVGSVLSAFSFETIENNGNLSNGDIVTVKVKTDNAVLENAGVNAKNTELQFTVEGLKDKEKVDIFKDVSLTVNGTSPQCSVALSYNGTTCSPFDFKMQSVDGKEISGHNFKNGDKIVISLNDNALTSLKEKYIVEETSREYTVQAEKAYISSAADLSEKDVDTFKKVVNNYIDEKFKNIDITSALSIVTGLGNNSARFASIENIEFETAYFGTDKSKSIKYAYFFYKADISYTYFGKETTVSEATLIVRVKEPVISSNGDISAASGSLGARKDLQTALDDMLKGDFEKIA